MSDLHRCYLGSRLKHFYSSQYLQPQIRILGLLSLDS